MQSDTAPRIYVEESGTLSSYSDTEFASEDAIQELLANHPELLAGELLEPGEPLRWLLIAREMGVPDSSEGGERWALDHLFVDQHGVPTFVEVKRASNRELRRQVIGQILDYAANGARWWEKDTLVLAARRTIESRGDVYEKVMSAFLGEEGDDPEGAARFWTQVMENLENGKVRLVIAADRLPTELVTVIEFLNKAMPNVQVVGLQLQQFTYDSRRIFVPRVRGLPEEKATVAGSRAPLPVNEQVRQFLYRVRDNAAETIGENVLRYRATSKLRKVLYYAYERQFGYGSFKVHFGGYLRNVWNPIYVGFELTAKDTETRDEWKKRIEGIHADGALPEGTEIEAEPERKTLSALVSFDYENERLTDDFALRIVNTLGAFIRAIGPEIERAR